MGCAARRMLHRPTLADSAISHAESVGDDLIIAPVVQPKEIPLAAVAEILGDVVGDGVMSHIIRGLFFRNVRGNRRPETRPRSVLDYL